MKGSLLARSLVCVLALLVSGGAALAAPPPAAPTAAHKSVGLQLVADGLTAPLTLVAPPEGSGRRFIVDQIGTIRILTAGGKLLDGYAVTARPANRAETAMAGRQLRARHGPAGGVVSDLHGASWQPGHTASSPRPRAYTRNFGPC